MSTEETRVWGIHSLDDNLFLKKDVIALGWSEMGDLNLIDNNRDAYKDHYAKTYPDSTKGKIATSAGMLYRFRHEIKTGDYVVFPSKIDRKINIGIVESDYYYEADGEYVNRRKVKWLKHLPRTYFSQGALYEIGSAMSFFSVKNYADEFLEALAGGNKKPTPPDGPDNTIPATSEDIKENTKDYILKELSKNLKGHDFELFLADLLRAMGYRAEVSPQGGDSGIDITAYKDELPPRILVQAKSGDGDIKEATIQSLKGAMREGDYGLFVTLADYKPNARKYLESVPIIKGINGIELCDLILKYYEDLSEKYQRLIPLEKVYIPVPPEE